MRKLRLFLFVLLLASFVSTIHAGDKDLKNDLPKLMGTENSGTEFYLTFIPVYIENAGENYIKIYFASEYDTEVNIEIPGIGFDTTTTLQANLTSELELTPLQALPYMKELMERPMAEQVFEGRGIHITSTEPIICYPTVHIEYSTDAYLALPLITLGDKYIVASYPDPSVVDKGWQQNSLTACVATATGTKVLFKMGGTTESQTAGGMIPGETNEFDMTPCDVVVIGGVGEHADLTGSIWTSNAPIAVVSGNFCAFVPRDIWAGDHLVEMEIPVENWGKAYPVTPIFGRNKPSIIRIFASEAETSIMRDGVKVAVLGNSNGTEGEGWLEMRASDIESDPVPVVISADKPISVTQYNTGIKDDNSDDTDPFQMVLLSTSQFSKELMFIVPGIKGGVGFDNNYINLVYRATESDSIPDDIQIAEVYKGKFAWKKIKNMSPHPGTKFNVRIDNQRYFSKTIRLTKYGTFKIKADAPFAAYSYGNSWCDTYGFPSGIGSEFVSVENPRGEDNITTGNVEAYPSPARAGSELMLKFKLLKSANININLYDASGKKAVSLGSGVYPAGPVETGVSLPGLSSGVYILSVEGKGLKLSGKIIIE